MGHRSATPFLDGQSGLSAIQRLNLAFFIDTEHDCLLRRIQVQSNHVGHLLQKLRIARQLESLRAMWLQLVSAPDIVDRGLADALALCHGPATLVGHPRRFSLQSRVHDRGDLVYFIEGFSSAAWSNVP